MRGAVFGLFALLLFAAGPASAQAPPARVGRVSLVTGNLAFHMASERAWSAAARNYPVASGASFWNAPNSRTQMELGPNTLTLDGDSNLDVTALDATTTRLGLWSGRLHMRLRAIDAGASVEIDTARGNVWLLAPGEYDIAAGGGDEPTRIAAFTGRARFVGQGSEIGIAAGQMAVLRGENPVAAQIVAASADQFVAWCRAHDYQEKRLAAPYYLSPEVSGYAALDAYGRWAANPEYGEVWYPNDVPADWAPYRFGEWVSVAPWGWTWIDEAPWGFAPFHYGRWAFIGDRWGWIPGRFEPRPVYAPALVVFIGGAGIGWFPLGPGEAYWPSYTTDIAYIRRLNAGHVKDIDRLRPGPRGAPPREATAHFANRRFATAVPRPVFERGGRVDKARLKLEPTKLERAPVLATPPKIAPVVAHPVARPPVPARPAPPGVAKIAPPATEQQKKAREEALRERQEKARAAQPQQQQEKQRAIEEQQRAAQQRAAQQRAIEQQRVQQHPPPPKAPPPKAPPPKAPPPPPKAPPPKGAPACGHPGEPPCPH